MLSALWGTHFASVEKGGLPHVAQWTSHLPQHIKSEVWTRSGSNRRPRECHSRALPAELRARVFWGGKYTTAAMHAKRYSEGEKFPGKNY